TDNMVLKGITLDRLGDRSSLLHSIDHLRREIDSSGKMSGLDSFSQQAVGILTSSKLADALDISKGSKEIQEKYGTGDKKFRDDWTQCSCALLAGGGMRTGQVIGATNRLGEHAVERPVTFQEVWATLYHNLGLNLRAIREFDLRGRPQYLVDQGIEPLKEVI